MLRQGQRQKEGQTLALAKRLTANIGDYSVLVCGIGLEVFVFICISRNVFIDVGVKFCGWQSFNEIDV